MMINGWQDMETAPKDGTAILVARDNGCGWDYAIVWWNGNYRGGVYPWVADYNAYPEHRFDAWKALDLPYEDGGLE